MISLTGSGARRGGGNDRTRPPSSRARTAATCRARFDASRDQDSTTTNLRERAAFQDGKKRIAIISDAASTGVSLHRSHWFQGEGAPPRPRDVGTAWSADKCIQQLAGPTLAPGRRPSARCWRPHPRREARFAAAVHGERALASWGALAIGDRRAASGQLGDPTWTRRRGGTPWMVPWRARAATPGGTRVVAIASAYDPDGAENDARARPWRRRASPPGGAR